MSAVLQFLFPVTRTNGKWAVHWKEIFIFLFNRPLHNGRSPSQLEVVK